MNTKPSVKLIKNREPKASKIQADVEPADDTNRWSEAVRSWIVEFQEERHDESLPAFDSLFKDTLS